MELEPALSLTPEGWRRLQTELDSMQERRDSKLNEYLTVARGAKHGDVKDDHLRSEIAFLNQRIRQLKDALGRATTVASVNKRAGTVGLGSRLTVRWEDGQESTFVVVEPLGINPGRGHISYESPVGRALLERRKGESVEVETPDGPRRLVILDVQ